MKTIRCLSTPYGVASAPAMFQELMDQVLQGRDGHKFLTSSLKSSLKSLSSDWVKSQVFELETQIEFQVSYGGNECSSAACRLVCLKHSIAISEEF